MNAFELSAPLPDFLVRGTVIYFAVVIAIRLLPKREIGDHSPSDMLALVMMGALVADGMSVGSEEPIDFLLLAVVVLAAFFLLQAGRLTGTGLVYQLLNLFGAGGVLVSLLGQFNVSVFLLEATWVAISAYGIVRSMRARNRPAGRA